MVLTEELDLLKTIAGKSGEGRTKQPKHEGSIIATYNAYLPFYEEVLLQRLVSSGCQHNVLLMDETMLAQSLASVSGSPKLAGRKYTLVPMRVAGAFHPKITMLVGKKSARILIGSHNVTLSGFGRNRELTTLIDVPEGGDDPNAGLAQSMGKFLGAWLQRQRGWLPDSILDAAERTFSDFAPWLLGEMSNEPSGLTFAGTSPEGETLWHAVRPLLPQKARRVVVCGPFFDRKGQFLNTVSRDLTPAELVIGVEQDTVEFCSYESLPENARCVDASSLWRDHGYLHAKAVWVEGEEGDALITGSANPSSPAWTLDPTKGNVEAIIVEQGEAAYVRAKSLGITSIASLPPLGDEVLRRIAEESGKRRNDDPEPPYSVAVAEAHEREILLKWPGVSTRTVEVLRCWDYVRANCVEPEEVEKDASGVRIVFPTEEVVSSIGMIEAELSDGKVIHAFVHHPVLIGKLSQTSTQRKFRDALDSLGSNSPDLPTLIRLAENLIFESDRPHTVERPRPPGEIQGDDTEPPERITVVISEEETWRNQKKVREWRGGDLTYIIDVLIHNLGIGLRTAAEQLESDEPNEEEQVGSEEEQPDLIFPKVDIAKVCQGKIRTIVTRMLGQFEAANKEVNSAQRPIDQLLAVLAVIREVRAQDGRLSVVTGGQSLVPLDQRKRLLDGSVTGLFGRNSRLFDLTSEAFEDDPNKDVSRLLGLLLWLAWDSGLDGRALQHIPKNDPNERRERLLELALLLNVALAVGKNEHAFGEAQRSMLRTVHETGEGAVFSWINYHRSWCAALVDIKDAADVWTLSRQPAPGNLGIAVNEKPEKKIRVVLGLNAESVILAEVGEGRKEHKSPREKQDQVQFQRGFVATTELPSVLF
jgi:hypothetical protein